MENEGLDKQSMVGSSSSMDPFEGLYSIEEETIEMQSNLLVDNTMVESRIAVMNNVPLVEPKCHEEVRIPIRTRRTILENCVFFSTFIPRNMLTFLTYRC